MNNTELAIVEGVIRLLSTEDGGLSQPMPSPTRSLILIFGGGSKPVAPGTIGAQITALDGGPLCPGTEDVPVRIEFWAAQEGLALVADSAAFSLWYGRIVGSGHVSKVVGHLGAASTGREAG